jgi:predicted CoA-substrate-specific enzyme activase
MITLGIDIGCISVKMACVGEKEDRPLLERIARGGAGFKLLSDGNAGKPVLISPYKRLLGHPLLASSELLESLLSQAGNAPIAGIRLTGRGGRSAAENLGGTFENEFKAIARAAEAICPEVRTIFEMGGETSKYIRLEKDPSGRLGIADYEVNGDCAAGTGSFMDQQAKRLRYAPEDIGGIVCTATSCASIAGRCSVFAKSDMIHAQQKGFSPEAILKGLCLAVVRNYKGSITKGKRIEPRVALIGGLAGNQGVTASIQEFFNLKDEDLIIPEAHAFFGAIGAALLEASENGNPTTAVSKLSQKEVARLREAASKKTVDFPTAERLSLEKVQLWRDRLKPHRLPEDASRVPAYLGIDIGSVSTNLVAIDSEGRMLKEIYLLTEGRPIEVVGAGLEEIAREMGDRLIVKGVGTTGSGRELVGELVGADLVTNEITAHHQGANFISRILGGDPVDTIFEVGGQDSKFISIDQGVIVDFAMNEACAAGTGSFLEEQAEKLGMSIKEEFARLALSSPHPARLGERCTVFMEQDLNAFQHRGATRGDLAAGLAYSVVLNYLNRVVRERKVGEVIYFQGGTAYNDAVAAAFSRVLDKPIIVPPYNGVIGALGMALLARERMEARKGPSRFRGYEIGKVPYTLKEFVCRACGNICEMQEFTIEGQKTYWGDKCSDRFRKKSKTERSPVIPDLVAQREEWLYEGYEAPPEGPTKGTVGFPRGMYFFDKFPFWRAFFQNLGYPILLSESTNRKIVGYGTELAVGEPCFPVKVMHGHVADLLKKGATFVFLPNVMDEAGSPDATYSHLCPWGQTLPWVLRAVPSFEGELHRFLTPTLHFRFGPGKVKREIKSLAQPLGVSRKALERAIEAGYRAQERFQSRLYAAGGEALETLKKNGERGILILGRPYNLYDRDVNVDILGKLRQYYGANLIPLDFLPLEDVDIRDVNTNMFWNYGRKLIAAAKLVGREPNLELLYVTNFKCGPDSYLKHFIPVAARKPLLILQFDEHNNDAGTMTRCEAFLDSKGMM